MKRFTADFETRSKSNLKLEGAYKYSLDPTTQPTCFCFKIKGNPTIYFLRFEVVNRHWNGQSQALKDVWQRLVNEGYLFTAHNAFFERCIYENILVRRYGWPPIHPTLYRCTAAKAAACALPRNLEGAGEAMALSIQKDKRGYNAMMATCKPTKQYNAWVNARAEIAAGKKIGPKKRAIAKKPEPPAFLEYADNTETWETLYRYCKIDVKAEEKLDEALPDLNENEQEIWHLNQKLNWRGLRVDIPTVHKIIEIMNTESKKKLNELDILTMGLVTKPGARKSILEFLKLDDIELPDIRAKTVEDVLRGGNLSEDMRRLLEIRQALSKTSTRKYQTFLNRACVDDRVRDILLYHGASTGRDTGTGIQPHNFPRGVIKISKDRPYAAVENIIECEPEELRMLYGEFLSMLFASTLRNMILPSEGYDLYVADFSKIEVAVLWWLCDNREGLEILNSGKDPYIYQAARNTGKTYEEIERAVNAEEKWALDARQLGKAQILGCGFGMGWKKFQSTAFDQYRLKLTTKESKAAVNSYREANERVTDMWKEVEWAAIEAVKTGKVFEACKCKFFTKDNFLWVRLPSGRRLAYRYPEINWRVTEYEVDVVKKGVVIGTRTHYTEAKETLEFWAPNSKTKKWALERSWGGTLTENIVQAVARDLMMQAAVRLEKKKYRMLLTVHDEAITEKKKGTGSLEEFEAIMCERPKWADALLPIQAKAWAGPRYRK